MTTKLRMIYEVLSCFSTATQVVMCEDLLRQLKDGKSKTGSLASHFAEALVDNALFSQIEHPFFPTTPRKELSRNPVAQALKNSSPLQFAQQKYAFKYLDRECPHLRTKTLGEQKGKGWIDYVGQTTRGATKPILGEIKWKDDKNAFYAFIQLLTYLSEIATSNQTERALRHALFGPNITEITAFDLHLFLANLNPKSAKHSLTMLTKELAVEFKKRLQSDHPDAAKRVGNVLCISADIAVGDERFSRVECQWIA